MRWNPGGVKPTSGTIADTAVRVPAHTEGCCDRNRARSIGDLHFLDRLDGLLRGDLGWVESGCELDVWLWGCGRVIPHASLKKSSASATLSLPIAMIEATLGAMSMPPPGATQAVAAGGVGAGGIAVDVTPVAAGADRERTLTAGTPRQSQSLDRPHLPSPPWTGKAQRRLPATSRKYATIGPGEWLPSTT